MWFIGQLWEVVSSTIFAWSQLVGLCIQVTISENRGIYFYKKSKLFRNEKKTFPEPYFTFLLPFQIGRIHILDITMEDYVHKIQLKHVVFKAKKSVEILTLFSYSFGMLQ